MQIPKIVTVYVNSLQHNVLHLLSVCFQGEMCVVSTTDHIELHESVPINLGSYL